MFDTPILEAIEAIYERIDVYRECNEEVINILISLHSYVSKGYNETEEQIRERHLRIQTAVRDSVANIIAHGLDHMNRDP